MKEHILMAVLALALSACSPTELQQEANARIFRETGLKPEALAPDGMGGTLTKIHRGYPILVRTQMGNVWGRYGSRLAAGEIGRAVGGIVGFLTGQHGHFSQVTGSQFDKVLSDVIGQPLSLVVALRHGKTEVSRVDILSTYSTIKPSDSPPQVTSLGFLEEKVFATDITFVKRLMDHPHFRGRIQNFRSEYIRVDADGVSFVFAGTETDFSAMIRGHSSYGAFLVAIMDTLADAADSI